MGSESELGTAQGNVGGQGQEADSGSRESLWVRSFCAADMTDEGAPNGLIAQSEWKWGADDIRSGAWQSLLAGACGIVYGVNGIWQMWDPEQAKCEEWLHG